MRERSSRSTALLRVWEADGAPAAAPIRASGPLRCVVPEMFRPAKANPPRRRHLDPDEADRLSGRVRRSGEPRAHRVTPSGGVGTERRELDSAPLQPLHVINQLPYSSLVAVLVSLELVASRWGSPSRHL